MKPISIGTQSRLLLYIRRACRAVGIFLLVLTLVGCLTSHAAGPSEMEQTPSPTTEPPLPTFTPTAEVVAPVAVTRVPNLSVRAFQTTVTPETATPTLTPTAIPDTATPTPEPTATATPEPTATATPRPTNTPRPTPIPTTAPLFEAYAWVDNYFPAPGSVVTVHGMLFERGRPVNGAQMGVTWSYTHGEAFCTAFTGIDGRAACAQNIGAPLQNYWVYIDIVFVHEDELYYAKTAFLTDP